MLLLLRALFLLVITSMLGVTSWASLHCPLFGVPRDVFTHPWFIATLFDAYWAFITFAVWVLPDMVSTFRDASIGDFLQRFGWAGIHAFTAWLISVPIIVAAVYYPLRPVLTKLAALRAPRT